MLPVVRPVAARSFISASGGRGLRGAGCESSGPSVRPSVRPDRQSPERVYGDFRNPDDWEEHLNKNH